MSEHKVWWVKTAAGMEMCDTKAEARRKAKKARGGVVLMGSDNPDAIPVVVEEVTEVRP